MFDWWPFSGGMRRTIFIRRDHVRTECREMTPEEQAEFDKAFAAMDDAFDHMGKALDEMGRAFDAVGHKRSQGERTNG